MVNRILAWIVIVVGLALFFFAPFAGACEGDAICEEHDSALWAEFMAVIEEAHGVAAPYVGDTLPPDHDTAREYMTVDTNWCISRIIPSDTIWCRSTYYDIDTIWLPKVQRWFTPGELEVFDAWFFLQMPCETHGHDWYKTGIAWMGPNGCGDYYSCSKCGESQEVPDGEQAKD